MESTPSSLPATAAKPTILDVVNSIPGPQGDDVQVLTCVVVRSEHGTYVTPLRHGIVPNALDKSESVNVKDAMLSLMHNLCVVPFKSLATILSERLDEDHPLLINILPKPVMPPAEIKALVDSETIDPHKNQLAFGFLELLANAPETLPLPSVATLTTQDKLQAGIDLQNALN